MRPVYFCPFVLTLISAASSHASEFNRIQGELSCDNCTSYTNVMVDVVDVNRRPVGSYSVNAAGNFEIGGLSEGNYVLTVRGPNGSEITSQVVSVHGETGPVSIRLPDSGQPRGVETRQASVSMYELTHKIPKNAKKEFEKALRAGDDNEAAMRHLNAAIEIDPQYVEALNNLSTRLIQVNRYDEALKLLDRAQKIDPASAKVQTNIAVALLALKKVNDAEHAARRAFQLASNDPRARYILALSLYNKQEYGEETIRLLQASRDEFPNANIPLAAAYARMGKKKEAKGVLDSYLAAGHKDRADQVREMLHWLGEK